MKRKEYSKATLLFSSLHKNWHCWMKSPYKKFMRTRWAWEEKLRTIACFQILIRRMMLECVTTNFGYQDVCFCTFRMCRLFIKKSRKYVTSTKVYFFVVVNPIKPAVNLLTQFTKSHLMKHSTSAFGTAKFFIFRRTCTLLLEKAFLCRQLLVRYQQLYMTLFTTKRQGKKLTIDILRIVYINLAWRVYICCANYSE